MLSIQIRCYANHTLPCYKVTNMATADGVCSLLLLRVTLLKSFYNKFVINLCNKKIVIRLITVKMSMQTVREVSQINRDEENKISDCFNIDIIME